jgi:hypothetical protein
MVKLDEKDLYQLLISEFRYSVKRDNHLAPGSCAQHVMEYLPQMSKSWRAHTAEQLTSEIIQERLFIGGHGRLEQDAEWEKLLVFLTNYIERLPYNIDSYMRYIYNKPTWEANIDYYSEEMARKIQCNLISN